MPAPVFVKPNEPDTEPRDRSAVVGLKVAFPVSVTFPVAAIAPLLPVVVSVLAPRLKVPSVCVTAGVVPVSLPTSMVEFSLTSTSLLKLVLASLRSSSVPPLRVTRPRFVASPSDCAFRSSTPPALICRMPSKAVLAPWITKLPAPFLISTLLAFPVVMVPLALPNVRA